MRYMQTFIAERAITAGTMLRIHPSMAFSSIQEGFIEVTDLIECPKYHHTAAKVAEAFIQDNTSEDSTEEYKTAIHDQYMHTRWVEFKYASVTTPGAEAPRIRQYLPLEDFKNLISSV